MPDTALAQSDRIRVMPTGNKGPHGDVPVEPVTIKTATLEK